MGVDAFLMCAFFRTNKAVIDKILADSTFRTPKDSKLEGIVETRILNVTFFCAFVVSRR